MGMTKCSPGTPIMERIEFWSMPEPNSGCWLWLGSVSHGYGQTCGKFTGRKMIRAHRASWEAFHDKPVPPGQVLRHKCDVRSCVNPAHLELGSQRDNIMDAVKRGQHKHKLSVEDVQSIYLDGRVQRVIADEYGVTQTQIWRIKRRRTWKHILGEEDGTASAAAVPGRR